MKTIRILCCLIILLGCDRNRNRADTFNEEMYKDRLDYSKDTILAQQEFEKFIFYFKQSEHKYWEKKYRVEVLLRSTGENYFLFDPMYNFSAYEFIHAYNDYYMFHYWSGGNYSRSSGFHVVKISIDTAIYMGLVCGYADIDSNGSKEFYYYEVVEMGEAAAFNVYGSFPCKIINDSIAYPGLFEAY